MDGGGRVLEPLIAGHSGGVAVGRSRPTLAGSFARLAPWIVAPRAMLGLRPRRSVTVPIARRLPALLGTHLTLGFFGAVFVYGAVVGGHADDLRAHHGEVRDVVARALGFGLKKVTISGLSELGEREVLAIAGISPRASLPFLSVRDIRARLEDAPLVRGASVRKLYPNELAISLVERNPYALWQRNGELKLVAADGAAIDGFRDKRFAKLPLVVGEGANLKASEYAALLEAAGPVRARIRAGMLVAGRRWTLKIDNGLDVLLPETGAAEAVARLVRLEREQRILDKDVLAVDLRLPDRVVVRLTEEAAAARAELNKKKPQRGQKGVET
ncbi:MAG: FtsQ-type POTRA domain-containing protein [Methylobacteriaceae bacterium]|nr:FtsQ-type POTRA domain-containing protein [Methylobacteriaceae bacterium]